MNDIPDRSILAPGNCSSEIDGSKNLIGIESFLWYENDDVSHFELLDSEEK
jgi:hypothetical protein